MRKINQSNPSRIDRSRNVLRQHRERMKNRLRQKASRRGLVLVGRAVEVKAAGVDMSVVLHSDNLPLCKFCLLETVTLVTQRKPLHTFPMPWWAKLLVRLCLRIQQEIFFKYGFAASVDKTDLCRKCRSPKDDVHNIEYKGVFTSPADAYWASNQPGGNPIEVPLNAEAPNETCTFRTNNYTAQSPEVRQRYQHQKLDLVAVPRMHLQALIAVTNDVTAPKNGKQ